MTDQVIWETILDHEWIVKVVRISRTFGELSVRSPKNREFLARDVPLSYGAVLGPDVDDVRAWEEAAMEFVDGLSR